jgi:hypothetical protein
MGYMRVFLRGVWKVRRSKEKEGYSVQSEIPTQVLIIQFPSGCARSMRIAHQTQEHLRHMALADWENLLLKKIVFCRF